jgi:hypothetical protein
MSHADCLNRWHLELAILAEALDHVLGGLEGPAGLRAAAHVLNARLGEMVESCPFPATEGEP